MSSSKRPRRFRYSSFLRLADENTFCGQPLTGLDCAILEGEKQDVIGVRYWKYKYNDGGV